MIKIKYQEIKVISKEKQNFSLLNNKKDLDHYFDYRVG
jgi:hypothetical protein